MAHSKRHIERSYTLRGTQPGRQFADLISNMSFAPIIHEVEEAIDNSRYGVRIHPPDQQIARDAQHMRYSDCNGRSTTAFVDDLAIIAH
eukprot:2592807-Karenia_brevis.AAC.1